MKDTEMKVGDKINHLTMIEPSYPYGKQSRRYAKFKCDCGNEKIIRVSNVVTESTKSCGCGNYKRKEPNRSTHGLCNTRINHIYRKMKQRCFNTNYKEYHYYGGRGITVCDEWLGKDGFINFYNWAMENGYSDELTIDRINVDGNYCPENCRWATPLEQGNNKRNNINITINNKTQTLAQWCRELGLRYTTILRRIKTLGWSYEEALELAERK